MFGLPGQVRACLFDLDGVLTRTAELHAAAWKQMFDAYLAGRPGAGGPFDIATDYTTYVDGEPRADGVRDFLAARGITLPEGTPQDPPEAETVNGLGNRKNELVQRMIAEQGVQVYSGSVDYVNQVRRGGLRTAVVSSSANTRQVLEAAGIATLFDTRVDGILARERGLAGKPAPDTYLTAAEALHVRPGEAAVFEDALSGVAAGRAGAFGYVVGVDRVGGDHAAQLREHGADIVVRDLAELAGTPTTTAKGTQA
jgi:beta-phosphoglucomutase family hydrolase